MQTRAKLSSSLAWLSKFVDSDVNKAILLTPYTGRELREEVIAALITPTSYASAYHHIYPSEPLEHSSFWPLIHGLARRGIYVLEGDETVVNDPMLKQKKPFRELAHLALLDGLMVAFVSSVVTIERVVKAVRNVSSFNPSKELPASPEGSLLLWVQKVTQAINEARRPEEPATGPGVTGLAPRQRRHNRMGRAAKAGGGVIVPKVTDIVSGIADGQCLAALLLYYAPQGIGWKDFYFSTEPLPTEQCLHNHNQVRQFCNAHLTPLAFHISPHHLVYFAPAGILKSNTDAMLAHLFWCLEIQGLAKQPQQDTSAFSEGQNIGDEVVGTWKGVKPKRSSQSVVSSQQGLVQPAMGRVPLPLSSSSSSLLVDPNHRGGIAADISSSLMLRSSLSAPQLEDKQQHPDSAGKVSYRHKDLISASVERLGVTEQSQSTFNLKRPGENALRLADGGTVRGSTTDIDAEEERVAYLNSTLEDSPLHDAPLNTPRSQHFLKQKPENGSKTQEPELALSSPPVESHAPDQTSSLTQSEQSSQEHLIPKYNSSQSSLHVSQLNHGPDRSTTTVHSEPPHFTKAPSKAEAAHPSPTVPDPDADCSTLQPKSSSDSANVGGVRGSFTVSRHYSHHTAPLPDLPTTLSQEACTQNMATAVASKSKQSLECHHVKLVSSQCKPKPPEDPNCVPREVLKVREKLKRLKEDFLKSEALHQQQWCRQRRELYFHLVRATVQKGRQPELEETDCCTDGGDGRQGHDVEAKRRSPKVAIGTVEEGKGLGIVAWEERKGLGTLPQEEKKGLGTLPQEEKKGLGTLAQEEKKGLGTLAQEEKKELETLARDEGEELGTLAQKEGGKLAQGSPESRADLQHEMVEGSDHSIKKLMEQKVQQLRVKLEEREKVRRAVAKERKRRYSAKRMMQDCKKANWDVEENKLKMQSSSETEVCRTGSDVLQYRLSGVSSEESHALKSYSHPEFITHDGPQCYVQPQLKSNKKLIKNALCHICLAGEVNVSTKQRALGELELHQASHFLILFRDTLGFKFRALYYLVPDEDNITKVFGNGPHTIHSSQISSLYKYNSGAKQFKEVLSKSFSLSVDALTIKNEFWHSRKSRPPF